MPPPSRPTASSAHNPPSESQPSASPSPDPSTMPTSAQSRAPSRIAGDDGRKRPAASKDAQEIPTLQMLSAGLEEMASADGSNLRSNTRISSKHHSRAMEKVVNQINHAEQGADMSLDRVTDMLRERPEEALLMLDQLLETRPNYTSALEMRGILNLLHGIELLDKALHDFNYLSELDPKARMVGGLLNTEDVKETLQRFFNSLLPLSSDPNFFFAFADSDVVSITSEYSIGEGTDDSVAPAQSGASQPSPGTIENLKDEILFDRTDYEEESVQGGHEVPSSRAGAPLEAASKEEAEDLEIHESTDNMAIGKDSKCEGVEKEGRFDEEASSSQARRHSDDRSGFSPAKRGDGSSSAKPPSRASQSTSKSSSPRKREGRGHCESVLYSSSYRKKYLQREKEDPSSDQDHGSKKSEYAWPSRPHSESLERSRSRHSSDGQPAPPPPDGSRTMAKLENKEETGVEGDRNESGSPLKRKREAQEERERTREDSLKTEEKKDLGWGEQSRRRSSDAPQPERHPKDSRNKSGSIERDQSPLQEESRHQKRHRYNFGQRYSFHRRSEARPHYPDYHHGRNSAARSHHGEKHEEDAHRHRHPYPHPFSYPRRSPRTPFHPYSDNARMHSNSVGDDFRYPNRDTWRYSSSSHGGHNNHFYPGAPRNRNSVGGSLSEDPLREGSGEARALTNMLGRFLEWTKNQSREEGAPDDSGRWNEGGHGRRRSGDAPSDEARSGQHQPPTGFRQASYRRDRDRDWRFNKYSKERR
ncbi:uncharacterized protein VTP21DRAFT_1401 [Calcarisporiella thermophila]|uniref:uncharacterized protein n=1 Tax=Calcarisporiella thermophila TaxID=911321 RepID=UPI003743A58A